MYTNNDIKFIIIVLLTLINIVNTRLVTFIGLPLNFLTVIDKLIYSSIVDVLILVIPLSI